MGAFKLKFIINHSGINFNKSVVPWFTGSARLRWRFQDCQSLKATNSVMNWITLQINIYVFKYIIFVECDFKVLWLRTCKASLPKYIPKRKQDNGKNNIVISERGTQAFQSNSAVNGLVQNSCIWKAKPQHLKPTPSFSTDNDGHLG